MIVLACDTALNACAATLLRDNETLAGASEEMSRGQAERLPLMVRELMQVSGIAFSEIDRLAVTNGPGSFTGVRVGLSFARALALALNRPCVGVSTLEALALQDGQGGLRGALIETPGASYFALYEDGAPLIAPCAIERGAHEELIARAGVRRTVILKGPGVTPDTTQLARRAQRLDPAAYPPNPSYLRSSGAALPGGGA